MCNFFIFEKLEHLLCDCHAKGYNLVHYLSMMAFLVSLVSKQELIYTGYCQHIPVDNWKAYDDIIMEGFS